MVGDNGENEQDCDVVDRIRVNNSARDRNKTEQLQKRVSMVAWLTVPVHVDAETLAEATRLTLVASSGVDDASSVGLADVLHVSSHGALEEPAAAVAAWNSVVLPGRTVAAYQTASATSSGPHSTISSR